MKNAKTLACALVCCLGLGTAMSVANASEVKQNTVLKTLQTKQTVKKARNDRLSSLVVSKRAAQTLTSHDGNTVRLIHSSLPSEQATAQ